MGALAHAVERSLFAGLILLLAWAPIPLGSNRPWAWTVLELGVYALAGAWMLLWAAGGAELPYAARRAWPAFIVLAAWLAEQAMHVAPLPAGIVEIVSPESARLQHLTGIIGVSRDTMTLSIDPYASRIANLKGIAYAGVFFLALVLVRTRERALMLATVLVYEAVVIAAYGVLMHLGGVRAEYFGTEVRHDLQASGTYVNRNHFAGYLEMILALGIGLLVAGLSDRRAHDWRRRVAHFVDWILSARMVLRLSLCVLVIALTTTHSRMGNAAFFASLLVGGIVGIALSRRATRNTVVLLASLMVIDLAIVGGWFGVEKVAQRIGETTLGDVQGREDAAAHALPLIKHYAVLGSGPGTFYIAYPPYRPAAVTNFYDHAHNDYVQFAAESGLLGLALAGAFVMLALGAAIRAQWTRVDPLMRGMSFACIMGVTAILIHSWVDFNLQIPANACYFMVLLALGWISLHLGREETAPAARHDRA